MINQYWKVLKTVADYKTALNRLDEIAEAEVATADGDELELLVLLIKAYEDRYYPFKLPEPIDMIKLRMEEMGLKNKDLIEVIGSESHVSSVLSGKRQITLEMARKLSKRLDIRASIFINDDHSFEDYEKESSSMNIKANTNQKENKRDPFKSTSTNSQHSELESILTQMKTRQGLSSQKTFLDENYPLVISYAHNHSHEHIYILADMVMSSMDPKHMHTNETSDFFVRIENEKVK